jgi:hypothetical protein
MIKSERYGGGQRWYCDQCDIAVLDGRPTIQWTNSTPPAACQRCDDPSCVAVIENGRPQFVSSVVSRYKAVELLELIGEGFVCSAARGAELKQEIMKPRC